MRVAEREAEQRDWQSCFRYALLSSSMSSTSANCANVISAHDSDGNYSFNPFDSFRTRFVSLFVLFSSSFVFEFRLFAYAQRRRRNKTTTCLPRFASAISWTTITITTTTATDGHTCFRTDANVCRSECDNNKPYKCGPLQRAPLQLSALQCQTGSRHRECCVTHKMLLI